jgi:hypothetical protein
MKTTNLSLRRDHANFVSFCWIPESERLIIGTGFIAFTMIYCKYIIFYVLRVHMYIIEGGEILLVENLEFRTVIYPSGTDSEDYVPILSLVTTSRGTN